MRVANDPFCQTIIEELGGPIVSTSANVTGQKFPKFYAEVAGDIIRHMDYIVDYRQDDKTDRLPSVIAEFNNKGELLFIRE